MNLERILISSVLLAAGAVAQAHEFDPGGRIVLTCSAERAPRMADVARAVGNSHYWAPQSARQEILARARRACDSGAGDVVFVPPADQRYAATRASTERR